MFHVNIVHLRRRYIFPARTVKELIAIAKQQPGAINYSSPGFGTNPQMAEPQHPMISTSEHTERTARELFLYSACFVYSVLTRVVGVRKLTPTYNCLK